MTEAAMRNGRFFFLAALVFVPKTTWPQGDPAGPEFRVNTYTTNNQSDPSVATDSSGNFMAVWESFAQGGVFGQRYAGTGAPLGPEFQVNTTIGSSDPSVASDSSGDFVVVWQRSGAGQPFDIMGQRYATSGTALGTEFRVNTYTGAFWPAVASDTAGNFVAVWGKSDFSSGVAGIFGQRYASTGTPLGSEFRVNTYTPNAYTTRQAVASDASGNFVVVWTTHLLIRPGFGVFGQRYASSGNPLGSEFRVNTYTTSRQHFPSVAADSVGNFVVVWTGYNDQDGSGAGVFGRRFANSGVPFGPEFQVNTHTTGYQVWPSVAADNAGNFVVTWTSNAQDGSAGGVFGQRYASSGSPMGPEFRVNTYTTGSQGGYQSVAANLSGNFVVIWGSSGQDGSGYGVYGQRYTMIVPVELMHFRVE
jgi:hypothetical protein